MSARLVATVVCLLACASLSAVTAAPTIATGWSYTPYVQATGSALRYAMGQAWDSNGDYYVAEGGAVSTLYKFKKSALPFLNRSLDPTSDGLEFSKSYGFNDNADGIVFRKGKLYMAQATQDRIVELDLATGAVKSVIGTQDYPLDIKVDPLSGDLFFSSLASGRGATGGIYRISGIDSGNPVTTKYVGFTNPNNFNYPDGIDGISFAADGTIYASVYNQAKVVQISRPNDAAPVVTDFATGILRPDGTAVGTCKGEEVLIVVSAGDQAVYQYKLNDPTRTRQDIVTGASSKLDFAFVGPDNAFYVSVHGDPLNPHTVVSRLYNPDCIFTQPPGNPPPTGTCGASTNCQAKTVSTHCASTSVLSSGSCATLSFSSNVQNC